MKQKLERVYYIDWLRVLAVLLLIPFHTARIFDIFDPFYVKNATTSSFLSYSIIVILNQWQIPLLFLLAGASTWFALGFRSGSQYALERLKRLLIPFIFGILVIVPPQAYLARLRTPGLSNDYIQFLPDYFHIRGDLTGYTGLFTPGHLWFIFFLVVFALVALPLFLYWRSDAGKRLISSLAAMSEKPGAIYLFILPLLVAGALPDFGGKNPFVYITLFVLGFILVADARFQKILDSNRRAALILSVITTAGLILFDTMQIATPKYSLADVLSFLLRTVNMWAWIIAILGYGQRYLNFCNKVLQYASQGAYPFYILHQSVIVIIGFLVVQWDASIAVKFIVIASASLLTTIGIYDLLVKRTNLTRFLFGMKPMAKIRVPNLAEKARVHEKTLENR